jgi:hypothetical protein
LLGIFNGTDPAAGREDVSYGGLGKALEPLDGGRTEQPQRWVSFGHEERCWEIALFAKITENRGKLIPVWEAALCEPGECG